MIDEAAERAGPGRLLVAGVIQAPAAQRSGRLNLNHRTGSGPVYRAACGVELGQQDGAAHRYVRESVR